MGMWRDSLGGSRSSDSFLSKSEGLDHAEGASTGFMVATGGVLSEGYGHGGPCVCLGDGQREGRGRTAARWTLLRRMSPYALPWPDIDVDSSTGTTTEMTCNHPGEHPIVLSETVNLTFYFWFISLFLNPWIDINLWDDYRFFHDCPSLWWILDA